MLHSSKNYFTNLQCWFYVYICNLLQGVVHTRFYAFLLKLEADFKNFGEAISEK